MHKLKILLSFVLLQSCAYLHHIQIGDIDQPKGYVSKPIEIRVSETGVSTAEIGGVAKALSRNGSAQALKNIQFIAALVSLFQMGPRTGKETYDHTFVDEINNLLYERCPSGKITAIESLREFRNYPVVSGEIVKIKANCLMKKEKFQKEGSSS